MRCLLVSAVVFASALPAFAAPSKFGKVNVAGVSVAGLDQTAATRRLRRELAPKLAARVALSDGTKLVARRRRDLGVELDLGAMLARAQRGDKYVPLQLRADRTQLTKVLRRLAPAFSRSPRNARPVLYRGRVVVRPEVEGSKLNVGGSVARVAAQVESSASAKLLKVATTKRSPTLTRARLKGINAVLGTFTTRFNPGNVKRTNNMRLAIAAIDGTLLSPGETFSLNGVVGDRTQAKGYRTTIIFKNGYKVSGIGGGVSQVTGTIFNAALLANLPIVTYRTHSRPVAYLPIGRDATVSYGDFDMKFKNDKPGPIFVQYRLRGDRATATLFGPRSQQKVSLRVVSKRIGPREIKAQLYRTVRQNGKVVKKEKVGDSHYKWKDADWEE